MKYEKGIGISVSMPKYGGSLESAICTTLWTCRLIHCNWWSFNIIEGLGRPVHLQMDTWLSMAINLAIFLRFVEHLCCICWSFGIMGRKEFDHMMPSKKKIHTARYLVVFAFSFFGDFLFWKSGASFSCVLLKWTLLSNWGFCSKQFSSFFHLLWFWGRGHFLTYSFTVNLVLICLNKG